MRKYVKKKRKEKKYSTELRFVYRSAASWQWKISKNDSNAAAAAAAALMFFKYFFILFFFIVILFVFFY